MQRKRTVGLGGMVMVGVDDFAGCWKLGGVYVLFFLSIYGLGYRSAHFG